MNYYQNYNQGLNQQYNPVYGQNSQAQMPRIQPMEQQFAPQYVASQPIYKSIGGLQGKTVDSIDVVKATDIPLDGSINYFPLADNTAIITKQIQMDGTSKMVVFKPVEETQPENLPKFVTEEQLDEKIKAFTDDKLKDDVKKMKRDIEDMSEEIKRINKRKD